MPTYQKTPTPNLIKNTESGTYYLRGRFGGEPVRESLHTSDYKVARLKLGIRLEELRLAAGRRTGVPWQRLTEAITAIKSRVENDPSLKSQTRKSYCEQLDTLLSGTAKVPTVPLRQLSEENLQIWWKNVADKFAAQRANHMLMWLRRAIALAKERGDLLRDPAAKLKAVKIPRTRLSLLTPEQFAKLIADIRRQPSRNADHSADRIEFMTYCGLRPGELDALEWSHVDTDAEVISVYGGEEGTKNRTPRRVPMTAAVKDLIQRMKERQDDSKYVFKVKSPQATLRNACRRLGFPHQRIYDLRHTFATACAKGGVDVPTFAKWLGHKDGGMLAMKTYVHPDDAHSKEAVKKVQF